MLRIQSQLEVKSKGIRCLSTGKRCGHTPYAAERAGSGSPSLTHMWAKKEKANAMINYLEGRDKAN